MSSSLLALPPRLVDLRARLLVPVSFATLRMSIGLPQVC